MTKDPNAAARARKAEEKAGGVISIQLGGAQAASTGGSSGGSGSGGGVGFKKGGFKKSGFKSAFTPVGGETEDKTGAEGGNKEREREAEADDDGEKNKVKSLGLQGGTADDLESDTDDEGYEVYDPRFPTD